MSVHNKKSISVASFSSSMWFKDLFQVCHTMAVTVIAGELEGSWRAGGQQEGLQYNGEAAGWKVISDIFL